MHPGCKRTDTSRVRVPNRLSAHRSCKQLGIEAHCLWMLQWWEPRSVEQCPRHAWHCIASQFISPTLNHFISTEAFPFRLSSTPQLLGYHQSNTRISLFPGFFLAFLVRPGKNEISNSFSLSTARSPSQAWPTSNFNYENQSPFSAIFAFSHRDCRESALKSIPTRPSTFGLQRCVWILAHPWVHSPKLVRFRG